LNRSRKFYSTTADGVTGTPKALALKLKARASGGADGH
jgi:hypothetical protein